jgi:hypothetical protein
MTDLPTTTPVTPPAQQPSIQDHVNSQKHAIVTKAQELINISHGVIDSWLKNFLIAEKIKTKRTDQVNKLLGFVNQIANEGIPQVNAIGNEIKDPEISNKVLECNNVIMMAARNILTSVQEQEAAFQEELKKSMQPPTAAPKTEVKIQEA